ncbi:MAG: hypothetical protein ACWGQW_21410, partial [bacterium]
MIDERRSIRKLYPGFRISEHRNGMNGMKWMFWCQTVVAVVCSGSPVCAQAAIEFQPGLDIDRAGEKRLEQVTSEILSLLALQSIDLDSVENKLIVARKEAEALNSKVATQAFWSDLELEVPSAVPFVLYASTTPEEIAELWKQQVDLRVKAVHAV